MMMNRKLVHNRILAMALTLVLILTLTQTALYAQAETDGPEGNPSDGGDEVSTIINPDEPEPVDKPGENQPPTEPPTEPGGDGPVETKPGEPVEDGSGGEEVPADPPAALGDSAIVAFAPLAGEVAKQQVTVGTPLADLALPDALAATVEDGDGNQTAADIPVEGWRAATEYDPLEMGAYTFTPELADGYTVADGVALPEITVEVVMGVRAAAAVNVEINAANFPDDNFRQKVSAYDGNGDGVLSEAEINVVKVIDVSSSSIADLTGIEHFTALDYLYCQDNSLTALDLSGNPNLKYLYCQNNRLEALDLSGNPNLSVLSCESNNLTALDISGTKVNNQLSIHDNPIRSLRLPSGYSLEVGIDPADGGTVMLTNYHTSASGIATLTATPNYGYNFTGWTGAATGTANSVTIDMNGNLTVTASFSVDPDPEYDTGDVAVIQQIIRKNNLSAPLQDPDSWDFAEWTGTAGGPGRRISALDLYNKSLTGELDVSGLSELKTLWCENNNLTGLNVSGNPALEWLDCFGNGLRTLELSANPALKQLDCYDNSLQELNLSANTALELLNCSGNNLQELNLSGNPALVELDCSGNGLGTLDLSDNPALEALVCAYNDLRTLDLSDNPALEVLLCADNDLRTLNLSANTGLIDLDCPGNNLTELNLSANTGLIGLDCSGNNLQELNLSANTQLEWLDCSGNKLTELNLSANTDLMYLYCTDNQLTVLDVSNTSLDGMYTVLYCAGNPIRRLSLPGGDSLQVSLAPTVGGTVMLTDYTHSTRTVELTATPAGVYGFKDWTGAHTDTADVISFSISGDMTLTAHFIISGDAQTPVITSQPQRGVYTKDAAATLAVTAEVGDGGDLTYQWYRNTMDNTTGGTAISGATLAAYSPPTTTTGTIYYYVVVTNSNSAVTGEQTATITSYTAAVTVNDLTNAQIPNITAQPQGGVFTQHTPVTLAVTAGVSDGGDLTYQWYSNTANNNTGGAVIPGAWTAAYTPPTALLGTTYYYVVVTNENSSVDGNPVATVTSLPAEVTVTAATPNPIPTLTLGALTDDSAVVGMDYLKTVPYTYDGDDPLSFQAVGLPTGLSIDSATGVITGRPADGTAGSHTVTVTVTDGSLQDSGGYTLTVSADSLPAALTMAPLRNDTVTVGYLYTKTPSVSYNGPDTLEYSATGLPTGLSIDTATGRISGSPTRTGTYSITVSVRERSGSLSDSQSYTLTVTGAPTGGSGNGSTGGGTRSGSGSGGVGSSTSDRRTAKTTLSSSAFSWDGGRTLTINHDSVTVLGLVSVLWNGQPLTLGTDFSAHKGSVILRFSQDFMAAQAPGEHTVRVEFLNYTGEYTLTLAGTGAGATAAQAGSGDATPSVASGGDTHNPQTGDFAPSPWWWLLALLPAAALAIGSAALIWKRLRTEKESA